MSNRLIRHLAAALLVMMAAPFSASTAMAQSGELWLTMDQVRAYELRQPVASIVVGNPAIADVTVQSNMQVLLYGKAPGLTNIYFFDRDGERVGNINVRVQTQTDNMLVVYRGTERTSYTCTRNCEMTPVVGDSQESFSMASGQSMAKITEAEQAASSASNLRNGS